MSAAYLGRALAIAGIVTGLLAIGLPYFTEFGAHARYVDDGTAAAFLFALLCFASWLPAEIGRDELGAAAGAAAFGFFLFFAAAFAFDELGYLDAGAWLGLCTILIPIGAIVVWSDTRAPRERPPAPLSLGLALLVAGIWLDADNGESYWNLSASEHAVGILMLLLAALNVIVLTARVPAVPALLVAATTFGFVEAGLVSTAFADFGSLGAGGWIEACAGVLLLAGAGVRYRSAMPGQRS